MLRRVAVLSSVTIHLWRPGWHHHLPVDTVWEARPPLQGRSSRLIFPAPFPRRPGFLFLLQSQAAELPVVVKAKLPELVMMCTSQYCEHPDTLGHLDRVTIIVTHARTRSKKKGSINFVKTDRGGVCVCVCVCVVCVCVYV